jgi:hypothetical protein
MPGKVLDSAPGAEKLSKTVSELNELIDEFEEHGKLSNEFYPAKYLELAILSMLSSKNSMKGIANNIDKDMVIKLKSAIIACLESRPHLEIAGILKSIIS